MSDAAIPDTGYDKKLNVNYRILLETLKQLDYDDFLRACPRYVEFVTEIDVSKLLIFRRVAEAWSDEEISLPNNLMDVRQFNDTKGEIAGVITREIKRGDPRNLEYEAVRDSMLDMNNLTANVTEKVMTSEQFMKNVRGSIEKKADRGIQEEEIVGSINQIGTELSRLSERLDRLEKIDRPTSTSNGKDVNPEKDGAFKEVRKVELNVPRSWSVRANDVDESFVVEEKRGKEEGGDLSVEISDGQGSLVWKVRSTKLGHSLLYERVKKLFLELLGEGRISTDLSYSLPDEEEKRNFSPETREGRVWLMDNWTLRKGLFNREYEQTLTFRVQDSSWSVDVRMKNSEVVSFKRTLENLMAKILLSGEKEGDVSRPYK